MQWLEMEGPPVSDINSFLNYVSRWPLFAHMASACICLGLSAIYHLFFVYSQNASDIFSRLDYGGIAILILGSTMPPINYLFACG